MDESRALELVERIHATAPRLVYDFAGAGAQALAWLHAVGGSSRTVLEATDRYVQGSLVEATGFVPERFTSVRVARALAAHARERARTLAGEGGGPVFGLGLSATIATDRAKRGNHRAVFAVADPFGVRTLELVLVKGARDRAAEEALVSGLVLWLIAEASGLQGLSEPVLVAGEDPVWGFEPAPVLAAFAAGESRWLRIAPDGTLEPEAASGGAAILSGSFDPLHDGHRELGRVAAETSGRELRFELPVENADKATIPLTEARRRAAQFLGHAPLLLTRAPLFLDKARLFPGSLFVVGADTAERLVDPRFYADDPDRLRAALAELRDAGTRFLVAARSRRGRLLELDAILADAPQAAGFSDLFEAIPASSFRMDVSSTEIREALRTR